jgi:hypothetical protein
MAMLQDNFKYYIAHQDELVRQYSGKYLVLTGCAVAAAEESEAAAYELGKERYGLGNFIVQLCTPGVDAYTMTFHTRRVYFDPKRYA